LAHDIIQATMDGADGLPVSIKTRIGQREYDESWLRFVLEHKPAALTVHWRTVKEMSKVDAHWEFAGQVVELRNEISPDTLLVGNGDVIDCRHGEQLVKEHGLDGIMIGRGIFHNPYAFSKEVDWGEIGRDERVA